MASYLGITGTPGTGKKSISPLVASRLAVPCLGLNDLAKSYRLASRSGRDTVVDTKKLGERIAREVGRPSLLFGHLLPYALGSKDVSRVVVLRCDPKVLKQRLLKRGYPGRRVADNVEAELIGVIAADSIAAFGPSKVVEFDTSALTPAKSAPSVLNLLTKPSTGTAPVDWLSSYGSASKLRSLLETGSVASALT